MTYYDEIASGYHDLHGREQQRKYRLIHARLQPFEGTVLDVGCGPGYCFEHFPDAKGVDPAVKLLDLIPDAHRHKALEGGAEALPFPENHFDLVMGVTVLQNFDDLEQGVKEVKRVGKDQVVLSFLKNSQRAFDMEIAIRNHFLVMDVIEDETDVFFFCKVA